ncbi:MAG: cupin domain-containing protein [Clostridiaceae bacterium]|nr:cupin domain-containing protein [Clostridiaceae bacterium]
MIRRSEEMVREIKKNMRDGKGEAHLTHLLNKEEFCGKGRLFTKIVLKPGMSIGMHQHVGDFEAYYILNGEATVVDNGKPVLLKAGDLMYTKDGESHSIENTGNSDLEFIALVLYS